MFVLHAVVMAVMLVVSIDATVQTQQSKPSARKPAGGQPKTAQPLFHDAFEAYKANRFKEAMEQFEKGLQQGPTNALAAFYLGEVCAKTGDQAKAQSGAAALAVPPARRGRLPQQRAARRGAAERRLARRWRMGYRRAAGVYRGRGPRDHRVEDAEGDACILLACRHHRL